MDKHKGIERTREVLKVVENIFELKHGEAMPKLLGEFIKMLGNEKDDWGGVAAMNKCLKEFQSFEKKRRKQNDDKATCKDFEEFLFKSDRNVIVIQANEGRRTRKEDIQGVCPLPLNPETLKRRDRPSSSKTVTQDQPKDPKSLKGAENPSTNKADIPAANQKILKVKIYIGTGWDWDFPKREIGSSPDLFANLTVHGGKSKKTNVKENSRTPCWGEEFDFPLAGLETEELVVEVYDHHTLSEDEFAGRYQLWVSKLNPGIQVIPLSNEVVKPSISPRLLVRFMFV